MTQFCFVLLCRISTLSLMLYQLFEFSSVAQSCPTPRPHERQASLSITNSRSPPRPMSIEWVMPSNHLILCHPLLLPSAFPSIRVFPSESALRMRWPKYWSFSFSISPSNEHQDWSPLGDSQESSPTPQFKSLNSLALSFLYSPTLVSIHDCWINHSLD